MRRAWVSIVVLCACDRGELRPDPPPVPVPVPVPVRRESPPYACEPPTPPPAPTKEIAIATNKLVLDDQSCVSGAYAMGVAASGVVTNGVASFGAWELNVISHVGSTCVFDVSYERDGRYRVERCVWDIPATIAVPRRRAPIVPGCTELADPDRDVPETKISITPGTKLRVGYQLFEDRKHTRPSTAAGAKGEVVFRFGLGEVGQGIEDALDGVRSAEVDLHPQVAQGLREKVVLAPDTYLCARLTVLDATPSAPPAAPITCAATEEWICQLGPTSVDRTTSTRGCGCGQRSCPDAGARWTTDAGGTWPDGARKLSYECIGRQEWARRARAVRKP